MVDFDGSVIADGRQRIAVKGVFKRRDVDNAADIHFHLDGGRWGACVKDTAQFPLFFKRQRDRNILQIEAVREFG